MHWDSACDRPHPNPLPRCGRGGKTSWHQSPKTLYPKQFHRWVFSDKRCAFDDGLRCKHAIKWVAMFGLESTGLDGVIVRDSEVAESVGGDEFVESAQGVFYARKFSDAVLGRDFPRACGADEHGVGLIRDGCRGTL